MAENEIIAGLDLGTTKVCAIVAELTAAQQIEYSEIADDLNSMGFETEPFGNRTIAVKA